MSPWLLHTIKTCGWAALSQVELPEPLHPSILPLIHLPSHYPSTRLSRKSKQPIFFFLLNGGSIRSAVHSYPLIAIMPAFFFMKGDREHLVSCWIIHNQFHGEADRQKTSEWRGINAWAGLRSCAFQLPHISFHDRQHFFFSWSNLWPRAFKSRVHLLSFHSHYWWESNSTS